MENEEYETKKSQKEANEMNPTKVKGQRSRHLYTATYRETWTAVVYDLKWRTDRH